MLCEPYNVVQNSKTSGDTPIRSRAPAQRTHNVTTTFFASKLRYDVATTKNVDPQKSCHNVVNNVFISIMIYNIYTFIAQLIDALV